MSQSVDEISRAALALPDRDKLRLLAELMESINEPRAWELRHFWLMEIRRLSERYDAGCGRTPPQRAAKEPVDRPSALGKYAHVAGSSEDFAREKQREIALEERLDD